MTNSRKAARDDIKCFAYGPSRVSLNGGGKCYGHTWCVCDLGLMKEDEIKRARDNQDTTGM